MKAMQPAEHDRSAKPVVKAYVPAQRPQSVRCWSSDPKPHILPCRKPREPASDVAVDQMSPARLKYSPLATSDAGASASSLSDDVVEGRASVSGRMSIPGSLDSVSRRISSKSTRLFPRGATAARGSPSCTLHIQRKRVHGGLLHATHALPCVGMAPLACSTV